MEIYTFNFTKKSTQWYLNEFRNMKFIATDSHSFPTNRNFIRIDDSFTENDIEFIDTDSYSSPTIVIKKPCRLINHNENMNAHIMESTRKKVDDHSLAVVMIDRSLYRIVACHIGNGEDDINGITPEIRKSVTIDKFKAFAIQFDLKTYTRQYVVMVLYNRLLKKYEYYIITTHCGKLLCSERSEFIGKDVMKEWEAYDVLDNHMNDMNIELMFNFPCTKYYITTKSYENELIQILSETSRQNDVLNSRKIITVDDDASEEEVISAINDGCDSKFNNLALSWYGLEPIYHIKPVRYNFIMSTTGKLMM